MEALEPRRVLAAPTLADLPDEINFSSGAQFHLALDGQDADGDSLTYTVTSDNPDISVSIPKQESPSGNRSMRITVQGYGEMVFELFEGRAPNTTSRIIEIAESDWYNDKLFHRVIDGFMIQGGSRDGTGVYGTGTQFDDEFDADLQFTSSGLLAMAKGLDDTNDSQFFITDVPSSSYPRWLDFNHTIFGKLTSGDDVREAISAATTGTNDLPTTPIVIESVEIFQDTQDAVMMIAAADGVFDTANVTVTVNDGNGGTASETFQVNALPDTTNNNPFLGPIAFARLAIDEPYSFQLDATDVEGDTIYYSAELLTETDDITVEVTDEGLVTITPKNEVVGVAEIAFRVGPSAASLIPDSDGNYDEQVIDTQIVTIAIPPAEPVISFAPGSDTGFQDGKTAKDNTTGNELYLEIENLQATSQLYVYLQGVEIPYEQITRIPQGDGSTNYVATIRLQPGTELADGEYILHVQQVLTLSSDFGNQELASDLSDPFEFSIDTAPPVITSDAVDIALQGEDYFYDVESDDEGDADVYYQLQAAPTGMTIDSTTGEIYWTASSSVGFTEEVVILAIDGAGNQGEQAFQLTVYSPIEITVEEGDASVDELQTVSLILAASDPQDSSSSLIITLQDGVLPADADYSLDPLDGNRARFTWNTTEADGPGIYDLVFGATDSAAGRGRETVQITVGEVNQAPEFTQVFDEWTGTEEERIDLQFVATDGDLPANELVFDLFGEVPDGAMIDAASGLLSWTPDENDGGQTFEIGVRVTDSGGLSDQHLIVISIDENQKNPVFDQAPARQVVTEGEVLDFAVTAHDPDIPSHEIEYGLEGDVPAGLTIDAQTGRIRWEVPEGYLPDTTLESTFELTVVARESASDPAQTARHTVEVTVVDRLADLVAATLTLTQTVISDPLAAPTTVSLVSTTDTTGETPRVQQLAEAYDDGGFFGSQFFGTQFGEAGIGGGSEGVESSSDGDADPNAPSEGDQTSALEQLLDEMADDTGESLLDALLAAQVSLSDIPEETVAEDETVAESKPESDPPEPSAESAVESDQIADSSTKAELASEEAEKIAAAESSQS